MARKKKSETVDVDELRQEMTEGAIEDVSEESAESAEEEGQDETGGDESAAEAVDEPINVADEDDALKVVADTLILAVRLTDHEVVEHRNAMIEALDEAKIARSRLKACSSECKAKEEQAMQRFEEAKDLVRRKLEDRPVECEQIYNYTRGMVYTRRLDTFEVIQQRKMQPYERQMDVEDVAGDEAEPEAEEATEAQADSESIEGDESELVAVGVDA